MEELLLRSFLTGNELDVVDEKEIDGPVLGAEFRRPIIADGIDEIIGEALGGEIERAELRVELGDLMSDRVKQVRLPQADAAVDEERVVRAGGQLGHSLAGRLSELVRIADDEGLEGIARAEAGRRGQLVFDRRGNGGRGLPVDLDRDARVAPEHRAGGRL